MQNVALANWVIDNVIIPYQKHLEETKDEKTKKDLHAQSHKKGNN